MLSEGLCPSARVSDQYRQRGTFYFALTRSDVCLDTVLSREYGNSFLNNQAMLPAPGTSVPLRVVSEHEIAARRRPTPLPADLQADWDLAVRTQHNLLLEGSPSDTEEKLAALKPHLREPLCEFRPTDDACVPQPREGTLILLEVARLTAAQQTTLLRWFDDRVPMRIVSTSSESLFSFVGSGVFRSELYYRLNIVLIELPRSEERIL